MSKRYLLVGAIMVIIASVFYVTFQLFASGDIVSTTGTGVDINTQLLYLKLGALAGFLIVALGGLYVSFVVLSDPDPHGNRRRDKERYLSWKVNFKAIQFPTFRSEDEEGEIDGEQSSSFENETDSGKEVSDAEKSAKSK